MRVLPAASLTAFALAGSLAFAPAAFAAERAEATLATPVPAPVEKIVDGRIWRCEGSTCVGGSGFARSQPIARECARAAKVLGAFTSFKRGGRELSAEQVQACAG